MAAHKRWTGNGAGDLDQTKACSSNIWTVRRFLFLREHLVGFKVDVNNLTSARAMTSIIQ